LYYAVESERGWLSALSLAALLSISEAGPLLALGLGALLVASRTRSRLGLLIGACALPLIAFNVWLSLHGAGAVENPALATALGNLAKNPVYFLWDLARLVKVTAIMHALAPLLLLPVLEAACWPLLVPALLFTSAGYAFWPNDTTGFGASVVWVPACFIALVHALHKRAALGQGRAPLWALVLALGVTVLSHSFNFGAFLRADSFGGAQPGVVRMTELGRARYAGLRKALAPIPAQASVAATLYLVSHISNRPEAYDLVRPCGRPDYLLISSREASSVHPQLQKLFESKQYKLVVAAADEFYLFSRGAETEETRRALTRLGFDSP